MVDSTLSSDAIKFPSELGAEEPIRAGWVWLTAYASAALPSPTHSRPKETAPGEARDRELEGKAKSSRRPRRSANVSYKASSSSVSGPASCCSKAASSDFDIVLAEIAIMASYNKPAGSATCQPLSNRNTRAALRPERLFPSTNAWLSAMWKA